ncbi:Permease of the drug/metabolite transporter (DMT) superfamily [Xaviernesmea oryzae]|uniref:Permease of the drug/metabolite transporter (DMT) superfamily n=1 Tax=Xaviernesmea oryzae TaxID=464029 RepID=A0A1X7CVN0_9HYPH|nr:DMT family transporter [Xaviernesmea oryzae]SMF03489.1 Permease of the drug/metabolite transporter (DMT) superfamily [Xaviernesmea oryzae]
MHRTAYLSLVIATLAWGGNAVAGKLAVGHVSPMMLTFCRWFVAVAIIFAISMPQIRKDWPVVKKNLPILTFLGIMGYVFFNAAIYTAVNYTTAINVTVEQVLIPMLIFVMNFALFRMKVSWAQVLGFTLTFVGGLITAVHGDLNTLMTLTVNIGDAIMMIAIVSYAVYTVALRWRPPINWRTLMAVPALVAMIFSAPLVLWEYSADRLIWPDATGWMVVLYTAVFASLVAQVLYIVGVEKIGPNRAGLFINLIPVFGTLLSVTLVGEALQSFHIVALALALGGIAIAEWGKPASV